jgi:plastocyanin
MRKTAIAIVSLTAALLLLSPGCGNSGAEVKAPRFNDSTPSAGAVYAAQPINITLNFSVDLVAESSAISVKSSDGEEWASGPVLIEDQNTAMKRELDQGMPEGDYAVSYRAALANGNEGDGRFSFSIDNTLRAKYVDLKGRAQVTIRMMHLKFDPEYAVVSPGTTVTWINEEAAPHFVNTETHPEYTYYPPMNSTELAQGQGFSLELETPGQYDYHCSLHHPQGMLGSIIVEP